MFQGTALLNKINKKKFSDHTEVTAEGNIYILFAIYKSTGNGREEHLFLDIVTLASRTTSLNKAVTVDGYKFQLI